MKGGHRRGITLLFIIYLAIVLRITVFRSTFTVQNLCLNGRIILTFFEGYIALIRQKNWFSFIYLFFGNIVWFVPFGMYLQYMGKTKTLLRAAACGLLFSLCIETMQYVFGTGYSELDDLILNTIGAWIGAAVVRVGFQKSRGVAD
ncbi:MAG: VanZ family protein [Lachnospiraceae bacterium]|nr:VanZ family protein [Lachnospiraceae bacterium]